MTHIHIISWKHWFFRIFRFGKIYSLSRNKLSVDIFNIRFKRIVSLAFEYVDGDIYIKCENILSGVSIIEKNNTNIMRYIVNVV